MHTGAECSTGINMKHHFIGVFRFDIFPGRNDQDIINIKLMEILLPVVDPVNILGLVHDNGTFSDIHELT